MRTNIDIDGELLGKAMAATGLSTKRATVEEALRRLVDNHELRQTLDEMKTIGWDGNLDEIRESWSYDDRR